MLLHVERVAGIEPVAQPWEGRILPLYYTRVLPAMAFKATAGRYHTALELIY